jgi:sulfur-oxidizing protein SoxZ
MASPMRIRANVKDGVTEVKVLMNHEMETGQRRDAAGNLVPAWFINEVVGKHGDKIVMRAEWGPSISKNPYFAFKFNGGEKGQTISVTWTDNKGDTRTDTAKIA